MTLKGLKPGTHEIKPDVVPPEGVEVTGAEPEKVLVVIEAKEPQK